MNVAIDGWVKETEVSRRVGASERLAPRVARGLVAWGVFSLLATAMGALVLVNISLGGVTGRDALFPAVIAALLVALGAYCLLRDAVDFARDKPTRAAAGAEDEAVEGHHGRGVYWVQVIAIMAVLVLALILVGSLGFFSTAILLSAAVPLIAGARPWWKVVLFATLFTAAIYVLFVVVLNVPFPTDGWLV